MNNINDILSLFKPYDYMNNYMHLPYTYNVITIDNKPVILNEYGLFATIDEARNYVKSNIKHEYFDGELKHYNNLKQLTDFVFSLIGFRIINPKLEYESDVQHKIWSHWMKYMYTQCIETKDGLIIPVDKVNRWKRQMTTDYYDLTEKEKQADRNIVNNFINGK